MGSLAERVSCIHCGADQGKPCLTAAGALARSTHVLRWNRLHNRMRHGLYVVRVKRDDARLGVTAGEEYVACTYGLDPGKVTLLSRIPDGHDPECNQYRADVEWLRWQVER